MTESPTAPTTRSHFTAYCWFVWAYLIGVILFGAWVRITGSGAGCGSHWPTCHGEVIPRSPSVETVIEYTHRLTSGLCGLFCLVAIVWSWRRFGGRSRVTMASLVVMFFVIVEGAIGAGLVLKELVADDASVARAVVISLHLTNTLGLVGAATLMVWWSKGESLIPTIPVPRSWFTLALVALVVTSMTGAITALGDTLFPVDLTSDVGLAERLSQDLSATQHFLIRLRILHPIIACIVAVLLFRLGLWARDEADGQLRTIATCAVGLTIIQVLFGFMNIALGAPGWMQLIHLLMAQILWSCFVALTFAPRPGAGDALPG
jgi:heme A synthase